MGPFPQPEVTIQRHRCIIIVFQKPNWKFWLNGGAELSMSLAGKGVIAIWQDLVPEFKDEYREWHNRQHIPERLGIPGFRRARRFIVVEGGPEFYTLYETDRVEDVGGKAYLDRLNAPTEWTRKIMPAFRNMARSVCGVAYSAGAGEGGFMLTGRFGFAPAKESALSAE